MRVKYVSSFSPPSPPLLVNNASQPIPQMGVLCEVHGEVMEILPNDLPKRGVLCDCVRLIGLEGTLALVRMLGGKRVFFPVTPQPTHVISRVLGNDKVGVLCTHFGGERLEIPLWKTVSLPARNRLIRRLYTQGENSGQLALRFHLCSRQIRNICAK